MIRLKTLHSWELGAPRLKPLTTSLAHDPLTSCPMTANPLTVARESTPSTFAGCEFCHGYLSHTEHDRCPNSSFLAIDFCCAKCADSDSTVDLSNTSEDSVEDVDSPIDHSRESDSDDFSVESCVLSPDVLADLENARFMSVPLPFQTCYTDLPIGTDYKGRTFYDPEPSDDHIDPWTSMRSLTPAPVLQQMSTFFLFWLTTLFWDTVTYLLVGTGRTPRSPNRSYRRRLAKRHTPHRLLSFLPSAWMIMTSCVMTPVGNCPALPFPSPSSLRTVCRAATYDIYHRLVDLDNLVSLETSGSWHAYNRCKGEWLLSGIQSFLNVGGLSSRLSTNAALSTNVCTPTSQATNLLDFPDSTIIDCILNLKRSYIRKLTLASQANLAPATSFEIFTSPHVFISFSIQ